MPGKEILRCGDSLFTLICNNCQSDIDIATPNTKTNIGRLRNVLEYECPSCGQHIEIELEIRYSKLADVIDITSRLNSNDKETKV